MVVVLDVSVMDVVDVLHGLKKGGRIFLNSAAAYAPTNAPKRR